jgi:hypothetical protein
MSQKKPAKNEITDTDAVDKEKMRSTSFDLAHLTATLKIAGIIPYPLDEGADPSEADTRNSPRRLILAATQFLATCAEVQSVLKCAEDLKSEQAVIDRKLQKLSWKSTGSIISIDQVIELAGAGNLQLTANELETLGIRKQWKDLSAAQQSRAMFLCLSSPEFQFGTIVPDAETGTFTSIHNFFTDIVPQTVLNQFRAAFDKRCRKRQQTDLETTDSWSRLVARLTNRARRRLAKSGVDLLTLLQPGLIIALQQAKVKRESKNATERAYKSHENRPKKESDKPSEAKAGGGKAKRKTIRQNGLYTSRSKDASGRYKADKTNSKFAEDLSSPLLKPQRKGAVGGE